VVGPLVEVGRLQNSLALTKARDGVEEFARSLQGCRIVDQLPPIFVAVGRRGEGVEVLIFQASGGHRTMAARAHSHCFRHLFLSLAQKASDCLPIHEEFPPSKSRFEKGEIFSKRGNSIFSTHRFPRKVENFDGGKLSRAALTVYDSRNVDVEMQFPPIPRPQLGPRENFAGDFFVFSGLARVGTCFTTVRTCFKNICRENFQRSFRKHVKFASRGGEISHVLVVSWYRGPICVVRPLYWR